MWNEFAEQLLNPQNRGRLLGIAGGLLFGVSAAVFGFLKTLFIAICVIIGYLVGKKVDEYGDFKRLLDRVINRERY